MVVGRGCGTEEKGNKYGRLFLVLLFWRVVFRKVVRHVGCEEKIRLYLLKVRSTFGLSQQVTWTL